MQHLNAIRAALKGAAPVIAVPIEGHAPICIRAKLFKNALKGVTVDRVELLENRWLKVTGRSEGGVHTCSKFAPMERHIALRMVGEWAIKERAQALKIISQGVLSAKEQRAMKLRKAEEAGVAELRKAQKDIAQVFASAKAHINPKIEPMEADDRAELEREYATFRHNRATRKRGAVIRWKLKALKVQLDAITKLEGPRHHKKVVLRKQKDKMRYAALLYQIGELKAQYKVLYPDVWREFKYADMGGYWVDSWQHEHPSNQAYYLQNSYQYENYNRAEEVRRLLYAVSEVRASTPPEDMEEVAA